LRTRHRGSSFSSAETTVGITLVQHGKSGGAITAMANEPIVVFVLDVKGPMVDVSMKGAKFNKLDMSK